MKNSLETLEEKIKASQDRHKPAQPKTESAHKKNANLVVEFISGILVPPLLGYWIDSRMDTVPLFIIIFLFLGVIGSTYNLYRSTQNLK